MNNTEKQNFDASELVRGNLRDAAKENCCEWTSGSFIMKIETTEERKPVLFVEGYNEALNDFWFSIQLKPFLDQLVRDGWTIDQPIAWKIKQPFQNFTK